MFENGTKISMRLLGQFQDFWPTVDRSTVQPQLEVLQHGLEAEAAVVRECLH
jgi:hypothetical protein